MFIDTGLLALFISSFLAATIIPAQSETVLAALHMQGEYDTMWLFMVATVGNVLGACVNYGIGRWLMSYKTHRWFPASVRSIERAGQWYQRFGVWTLLLSWLPFVGDPLTLVAGIFRTRFPLFILLVAIGKAARYAVVLWITS